MQLMKENTCTLVGCGTKTDNLQRIFQHMSEKHGWTWTKRYTSEFEYTFPSKIPACSLNISWTSLSIPGSLYSGPTSILPPSRDTHPIASSPLLQSHKEKFGELRVGTTSSPSGLQPATTVTTHHQVRPEERRDRGDDAEKGNNSEAHDSDSKSPNEEESEKFFSLTDLPKSQNRPTSFESFSNQHVCISSTCLAIVYQRVRFSPIAILLSGTIRK